MSLSAAIAGAANLDVSACPCSPTVFDLRTLPVQSIEIHTGGDAMNEASVLAALHTDVHLYTLLGNDMAGHMIEDLCRQRNIKLHNLNDTWPTSVNIVLVEEDGQRCFLTCSDSSMRMLSLRDIPAIEQDIVCLASLFVSSQFGLEDVCTFVRRMKKDGKIVCMDTTTAKHQESLDDLKPFLCDVDYFFTNEREAASITGNGDPYANICSFKEAGARTVLLKRGEKGVLVLHENKIWMENAQDNPECTDTTGCGDSFAGGFIHGLCEKWPFSKCLSLALQCGSLACTKVGATAAFEGKDNKELLECLQNL